MLHITSEQVQLQLKVLEKLSKQSSILYMDDFTNCLAPIYDREKEVPDFIKLPKSVPEMIAGDFNPSRVIDLRPIKEKLYYGDLPMWRNTSNKEYALHGFGLIEDNKTKPCTATLYDTSPHLNIGGATGHGKSITLNDIIITGALVHPPWKVQYYLNDPKVVELKPYATSKYMLPHVNTVAATSDPNYSISMLQYITKVMQDRNTIFEKVGVKNITDFVEHTGLEMPMLILILDECRSMYLKAGRLARVIDELIETYVVLARNTGGRCIMASQQVVEEMAPGTLVNINNRACLGCTADVSNKVIGNPGASINFGKRGKVTMNLKPSDKNIKDNIYLTCPFIPDIKSPNSRTMSDIFKYVSDIWDITGGERLESLSFYDDQTPLYKEVYINRVSNYIDIDCLFLGEPAFIYKDLHKLFHFSLSVQSNYDTALGNNILVMSPIAEMRYNILSLLLFNITQIKKKMPVILHVYSNIRAVQDKIKQMGYEIDKYGYDMDVEQSFYNRVKAIMYRNIVCTADERLFDDMEVPTGDFIDEVLKLSNLSNSSELKLKRAKFIIEISSEAKSKLILGLHDANKNNANEYAEIVISLLRLYEINNCESKQLIPQLFKTQFNVFMEYDQLKGVEIKTVSAKLDQYADIIRMGPLYGVITVILSGLLLNSSASLVPAFDNLIFYQVQGMILNSFKIRDDYPEYIGSDVFVYTNKKIPTNKCFKIKYPLMLGE